MKTPSDLELKLGVILYEKIMEKEEISDKMIITDFALALISREEIKNRLKATDTTISKISNSFLKKGFLSEINIINQQDSRKRFYGISLKGYQFGKSCRNIFKLFNLGFMQKLKCFIKSDFELFEKELGLVKNEKN